MEGKRLLEDDKKIVSFLNIKCSIASREGFFSCETVSKQILQNISGFAKVFIRYFTINNAKLIYLILFIYLFELANY